MKKLVYKIAGFLGGVALVLFSYFTQPSAEINKSSKTESYAIPDTQFQIGIINGAQYYGYTYIHDSLNFNVWHRYTQPTGLGWDGWNGIDRYDNDTSDYKSIVTNIIDANNNRYNMRTYMNRPIIDYIVAGQRIDYQCESVPTSDPYWFWAYNNSFSNGNTIYDTNDYSRYGVGERVKCCRRDEQNPGSNACWIDSGLKANRELSFVQTVYYMADSAWDWYVMPRIRIDSVYANTPGGIHDTETVCRIKIIGWRGDEVKNFILKVINFKDKTSGIYNGNYLEIFNFTLGQDSLFLSKDQITQYFLPDNNGSPFIWPDPSCLVDIKIYWSGKCDTWFDRVRVENLPAHQYLTLNDQTHQNLVSKVSSEITWSMRNYNGIPNYFYYDECQFSHFPVIKELNKQIMTQTNNQNCLIIWLNYALFRAHMPNCWDRSLYANDLKKYLYDDFGLRTIIMGAYALEGWDYNNWGGVVSYHPTTLSTKKYSKKDGILSHGTTPTGYDNWLQTHLDNPQREGTKLLSMDILMDSLSKITDMRIINCPQAHLTYSSGHMLKEPSREELELQTDLAITYNAKGIMYFGYESFHSFDSNYYQRGIINLDGSPRCSSVYDDNKFGKIKELSEKLNKWGPHIMSFNPDYTHSYIYRYETERGLLNSNSYFIYFAALKPGSRIPDCDNQEHTPDNIPQGFTYDCSDSTYLQIATFENPSEPNTKYFMVINRRCSPVNTNDTIGGKRIIRAYIKSNYPAFIENKKMKIVNIENITEEYIFETQNPGYINLGFFMPGEGKLYKIIPEI